MMAGPSREVTTIVSVHQVLQVIVQVDEREQQWERTTAGRGPPLYIQCRQFHLMFTEKAISKQ